jgi:hypothetical protein
MFFKNEFSLKVSLLSVPLYLIVVALIYLYIHGAISLYSFITKSNPTYNHISKEYIYALNDGNSVEGSFFLGSGNVDGKLVYTYAVQNGKGFALKQIDAEGVEIRYIKDNSKPRIEEVSERYKNAFVDVLFNTWGTETYIYVPKGTIKQNYIIDLK